MTEWEVYDHENGSKDWVRACPFGSSPMAFRVIARVNEPDAPEVLVLHRPGHKYFGGQYQPANYEPAAYIVLQGAVPCLESYMYYKLVEFPVKRS